MSETDAELLAAIGGAKAMASMLRRVRHDRDLSQHDVAARIQRPVEFVAKLEAGDVSRPSVLTAALLARACEVSVALFAASFALPVEEPLPWPRERRRPRRGEAAAVPGAPAFGAMLRELRMARNWSQEELHERSGIPRGQIGALERGKVRAPLLLTITRLSRAFATTTPAQISHMTTLAQSYAGEIAAPPLRRMARDRLQPPADPD